MIEKRSFHLVISFLTLRKVIGILGSSLPVILIVGFFFLGGGEEFRSSISSYYHTNMHDIFVGVLCAVSLFLFAYKGYDSIDNIAANLGGIFALGVALLPTTVENSRESYSIIPFVDMQIISYLHFASAALFFTILAYFSLFLFTKSGANRKTVQKKRRNRIYRICGIVMVAAIMLIAIYILFFQKTLLKQYNPVLILESVSLLAFGISWLVKGEVLLKDKKVTSNISNAQKRSEKLSRCRKYLHCILRTRLFLKVKNKSHFKK